MVIGQRDLVDGERDHTATEMRCAFVECHGAQRTVALPTRTVPVLSQYCMGESLIIVVTGLPGTGKTTFARALGKRYRVPVLCKDAIKEPLLDVLGAADAAASRRLSDASFAALFAMARELAGVRQSMVLEGNFRPGEHEPPLRAALASAAIAQVLCTADELERLARLSKRDSDPARHPGHRDREQVNAFANATGNTFLDLPGERFISSGRNGREVLAALDDWWTSRTL